MATHTVSVESLAKRYNSNPKSVGFARYADALLEQGKVMEATSICQQGLMYIPDYLSGYLVLGKCFVKGGRYDEAIKAYKTGLNLDKRCPAALKNLGDLYRKLQDEDQAAAYLNAYLEINPFDTEIRTLVNRYLENGTFGYKAKGGTPKLDIPEEDLNTQVKELEILSTSSSKPPVNPALMGAASQVLAPEVTNTEFKAAASETSPLDTVGKSEKELLSEEDVMDVSVEDVSGDDVLNQLDQLEDKVESIQPVEVLPDDIDLSQIQSEESVSLPEQELETPEENLLDALPSGDEILSQFEDLEEKNPQVTGEEDSTRNISTELAELGLSSPEPKLLFQDEDDLPEQNLPQGTDVLEAFETIDTKEPLSYSDELGVIPDKTPLDVSSPLDEAPLETESTRNISQELAELESSTPEANLLLEEEANISGESLPQSTEVLEALESIDTEENLAISDDSEVSSEKTSIDVLTPLAEPKIDIEPVSLHQDNLALSDSPNATPEALELDELIEEIGQTLSPEVEPVVESIPEIPQNLETDSIVPETELAGDDILGAFDALEEKESDVQESVPLPIVEAKAPPLDKVREEVESEAITQPFDLDQIDFDTFDDEPSSIEAPAQEPSLPLESLSSTLQKESKDSLASSNPQYTGEDQLLRDSLSELQEEIPTTSHTNTKDPATSLAPLTTEPADSEITGEDLFQSLSELEEKVPEKQNSSVQSIPESISDDEGTFVLSEEDAKILDREIPAEDSDKPEDKESEDLAGEDLENAFDDLFDGSLDEEGQSENVSAPSNVATVTLAEIYFKQGLHQQSLDIYRKLLERDPDNLEIQERIEQITTSISEAQDDSPNRQRAAGRRIPRGSLGNKKRKR